ncbi:MAG: protease modulator HflC [Candidatus Hydrogenedentes bacterium]|nr:protease modulator HflC [Candidatus Hydrogenedentota bacterium]
MNAKNVIAVVFLVTVIVLVFVFLGCTFVVDERSQAVVTRLNRPVAVITGDLSDEEFAEVKQGILAAAQRVESSELELDAKGIRVRRGAGLYFKLPIIDDVQLLPGVVLEYDAEPREIVLADKKKLYVDNYARWRIVNPLLYRVTVQNERNARDRLDDIIYSYMREELGKNSLIEVIRTTNRFRDRVGQAEGEGEDAQSDNPMYETVERGREEIMQSVTDRAAVSAEEFGIRLIDVRIKRADLVQENLEAVFGRMQAERSRISKSYRSEGNKEASIIRGQTDKEVQIIMANAERDARMLRGEGDAQAIHIIAEAFNSNPELYRFMRSLEVIEESTPPGSEFIIGLDSSIYDILQLQPE